MNPSDYKFEIGDKVITTYGEAGEIVDICTCEQCVKRGFHEPVWLDEYGDKHYITNYMADCGFEEFYKIGNYRFNSLFNRGLVERTIIHHENMLERYKKMLKVIDEYAKEA